jgi:nicotinate dehydrogenase subunit A
MSSAIAACIKVANIKTNIDSQRMGHTSHVLELPAPLHGFRPVLVRNVGVGPRGGAPIDHMQSCAGRVPTPGVGGGVISWRRVATMRALEASAMPTFALTVNGARRSIDAWDPQMPLLYALRNDLGLHAAKFGCGLGQCGACTVLVDDAPTRSCTLTLAQAAGKRITTSEGLGTPEQPHPVQAAFIAEQAAQCGYCTNGMVMSVVALLAKTPKPTREQAQAALAGNLCRCGSHDRVLKAVARAAGA